MNRLPLPLLFLLLAVPVIASGSFRQAQASTDLDKWNSETGRVIRASHLENLEKTTYREISSTPASKSNIQTVYPQIETKATVAGTKTKVVAEATLQTNKDAVKRDWKNVLKSNPSKLAGATLGGTIVGLGYKYAFDKFMDGLDWVMHEGGKIQRINQDLQDPTYSDIYQYSCAGQITDTANSCGAAYLANCKLDGLNCAIDSIESCSVGGNVGCSYKKHPYYGSGTIYVTVGTKIARTSSSEPEIPVSDQDIDNAINDVIDNAASDPKKKAIADAMTRASYARIWDEDGNMMEIGGQIKEAQKDILKDDNPKQSGKTDKDPKITDGTQVEGEAGKNPNPEPEFIDDPVTGQPVPNPNYNPDADTGSWFNFKLPEACDWFSKACEWMDWTKDEPDLPENSEVEIKDQDLINYQYSDHIKFIASCPFSPRMEVFPMGILGNMNVEVDFSYFCNIATMMKAVVISLSAFIAVLMLAYAAKDI